jgi:hypothetical protein
MSRFLKAVLGLSVSLAPFTGSLTAQSTGSSSPTVGVSSTYNLGNATFGAGSVQYTVGISISYNQGLTPSQYISPTQLTSDFNGFLSAYPNAGDPPEAILASVASGWATKYSQFSTVLVTAVAGSTTTATGSLGSFTAEISASASNLQLPGGLPGGLTDAMKRALKSHN